MVNVYIIDIYSTLKNNGLNTYIFELTEGLNLYKNIKRHYVWTNSPGSNTCYKDIHDESEHLYLPVNPNYRKDFSDFTGKAIQFLINEMCNKENVIVHFNWINHLDLAWHLKKSIKCCTILTKHCIPWRDFVATNYPVFLKLNACLEKNINVDSLISQLRREMISYDSVDHIITVTKIAKKSVIHLFKINENKISVIYNGIAENRTKVGADLNKTKLRQRYGFIEDEKLLIFVGNLHVRKGVVDLVEAFETLLSKQSKGKIRLIFVGSGNYTLILDAIKKYWSKIILTGSLDKKTLYDYYSMADIGIVPSYVEQCSYTAIEMMQSGLPVIVSNIDGLKEIVGNGSGYKVRVDYNKTKGVSVNRTDLIQKIKYLLKCDRPADNLAKRAKKELKNTFLLV